MSRKNGCPMSVREWVVEILSRAAARTDPKWIRVHGLSAVTLTLEAETEDGSAADSLWAEPYVVKRSGKLTIEGKPVADAATGTPDPGQAELTYFASLGGCAGDATLRLTDPYGRCQIIDLVVTDVEKTGEDGGEKISWESEIVGEPEEEAYVQLTGIAPAESAITLAVNETKHIALAFTPENASNRRYSAASENAHYVRVGAVQDGGFDVTGVMQTDAPVYIRLRSMNNNLTASIAVTVA